MDKLNYLHHVTITGRSHIVTMSLHKLKRPLSHVVVAVHGRAPPDFRWRDKVILLSFKLAESSVLWLGNPPLRLDKLSVVVHCVLRMFLGLLTAQEKSLAWELHSSVSFEDQNDCLGHKRVSNLKRCSIDAPAPSIPPPKSIPLKRISNKVISDLRGRLRSKNEVTKTS